MQREIRDRLRKGQRLREIAEELKVPYAYVQQVAKSTRVRYVGRELTTQLESEIDRLRVGQGLTIRQIAARLGLPKSKVGRAVQRQHNRVVASGGTFISPVLQKKARRCPVHGLLNLWPCVACAAEARRKARFKRGQ